MLFKIFRTEMFKGELEKLSKTEQTRIKRFENHLIENHFIGKPLGIVFLREKRLNGRRAYYLIYEDFNAVLIVTVSNKKTQQETIAVIKANFGNYYQLIKKIVLETNVLFLFFQLLYLLCL